MYSIEYFLSIECSRDELSQWSTPLTVVTIEYFMVVSSPNMETMDICLPQPLPEVKYTFVYHNLAIASIRRSDARVHTTTILHNAPPEVGILQVHTFSLNLAHALSLCQMLSEGYWNSVWNGGRTDLQADSSLQQ